MMESPQMYDQNSNALDVKKIVNNNNGHHHPAARLVASKSSCLFSDDSAELADLNTPEISLDLQGLIDESHFSEGIFREIDLLEGKHGKVDIPSTSANSVVSLPSVTQLQQPSAPSYTNRGALTYMTQHIHSGATFPSEQTLAPPIKKEPSEDPDFNSCNRSNLTSLSAGGPIFNRNMNGSYTNAVQLPSGYTPYTPATLQRGNTSPMKQESPSLSRSSSANSHSSKNKKLMDKHSDEYRRRRERNNIAVRKSREKAKLRTREIEERVKILSRENERLQKRVELLTKELNVLRSLFSNVGILPDQLQREIAKQLETVHPAMGL